ncbi:MAG: SurA N-terminal domain-containing protein [Terriglobia bacterium]
MLQRYVLCLRAACVLLALGGALGLISCSRGGNKNEVWARVNGTSITRDQVEAIYRSRKTVLPGNAKPEQALSFKLTILNQMIDRWLLLDRASQLQVTVSGKEVDASLAVIRSSFSGDDFQKRLNSQGLTVAEFRQQIHDNLTLKKLIQKEILSQVTVTSGEIARYYDHNKSDFNEPQTEYHLAQILVTPIPNPQVRNLMHDDARNEREAKRKIKALYAQVLSGKDFAKMAEDYSEDPRTAAGGGDMGFIPVSSLASDPTLSRTLDFLQPGQITGIIHGRSGYRIFKLLGRVNAGQRQLSDPKVEAAIRKTLIDEKEEVLKAAYIEDLRNHAHVVDYLAQQILQNHGSAASIQ